MSMSVLTRTTSGSKRDFPGLNAVSLEPALQALEKHSIILLVYSGCSASFNQQNHNCLEAIDGITNALSNGWAYNGGSSAWATFELTEKTRMNTLVVMSGQQRNTHRLITFRFTLNVDGQWINLHGLKVKEDPVAPIGHDGTVTLASGIQVLHLKFNTVFNVQSIRLDVTETDASNNNVVVNEIIPKYGMSFEKILLIQYQ